jgi:hypothetical protein
MTMFPTASPADRSANDRRPRRGRLLARTAGLVSLAAIAVLTLAACNNSDASSSGAQPTGAAAITEGSAAQNGGQGNGQNGQGNGQNAGGQRRPGASGLIAEVDSNSMQVQASDSQTTVNWTSRTTFAQTVRASLTDVAVGNCVVAIAPRTDTGTTGSSGATAAPSTPAQSAPAQSGGPITAGTVAITAAVDGECTSGFGGGFGGGNRIAQSGQPLPSGAMPTGQAGAPPNGHSGANGGQSGTGGQGGTGGFPGGGAGFGGIVTGKVTAVSGSTITVESTRFGAPNGSAATSSGAATTGSASTGEKTTETVNVTGSTTYTTEKKATASAVKTGLCATALGAADDTGAIAATSVTLSEPVNGECTSGARGFGGGRNGQGRGNSQGTTGTTANG